MQVTAIGTSGGVPTAQYGTSCIYLDLFGDKILLDCGEGSQQRLMRHKASPNVDAIFISHFYADHTLGLPGLVQALEMDERDRPLEIYVPEGRTQRATELLEGAYGQPSYQLTIHGYTEDTPALQTEEYEVRPFETPYTDYSHGFVIEETAKREFQVEKAQALGIEPGPKYGKLQNGQPVETETGDVIQPDDVLSEPKPGRKIVYSGDTRPVDAVVEAASNASLLIYSAMFSEAEADHAESTGQSTAREAGEVAAESDSDRLWLTHISPRHEDDEEMLQAQANRVFDGEVAIVRDGHSTTVTQS